MWARASGILGGPTAAGAAGRGGQVPSPGHEAQDTPSGQPAPLVVSSDAWRALHTQDDDTTAVAWDPCRPIHYVTRPDAAPTGARELMAQAIARVSAATGLRFIDDGASAEGPSPQREPYQPQRYGDRWAPVLITYVDSAEVPDIADALTRPDGDQVVRAVFEHERGHLVGLAHVDDPAQLMYPETSTAREYGAGDLTGLATLGTGTCVAEV